MKVEPRHVLAFALGGALLILPLLILSYDPESGLERLRQPLCRGGMVVVATDPYGEATLPPREGGLRVNVTKDGAPVAVRLSLFVRDPGSDWRFQWGLDTTSGIETFAIQHAPGREFYVRAVDPTGALCPQDSPVVRFREA